MLTPQIEIPKSWEIPIIQCHHVILSMAQDSISDFLDALDSGWEPAGEKMGSAARETLSCLSWAGKQASNSFVQWCLGQKESFQRRVVKVFLCVINPHYVSVALCEK